MIMFQCKEGDFEGETTAGAIAHTEVTGHTLTREDPHHGTTTTVSLDTGDDYGYEDDYFDPGDEEE